jgi:hypothetical protein
MRMIKSFGVACCVTAALTACDRTPTSAPEQPALEGAVAVAGTAARASAQTVARAIKGHVDGSDQYGAPCGEGQGILITSTGRGTVSHFGNAVMVTTSCVNLTDFSAIGETPYSLRAANGDEVGGLLTNIVFTSYGFDLYTSVTWGTGRFAGATGEIVWPTTSNGTGIWTSEVEGWISY